MLLFCEVNNRLFDRAAILCLHKNLIRLIGSSENKGEPIRFENKSKKVNKLLLCHFEFFLKRTKPCKIPLKSLFDCDFFFFFNDKNRFWNLKDFFFYYIYKSTENNKITLGLLAEAWGAY